MLNDLKHRENEVDELTSENDYLRDEMIRSAELIDEYNCQINAFALREMNLKYREESNQE